MEDFKKIDLNDLESVAGGYDIDQLSPEHRAEYDRLKKNANRAIADYQNGKIDYNEYYDAMIELQMYKRELEMLYG